MYIKMISPMTLAERTLSFRDKNQLALVPSPPNMHAVWPTPTAQGQERAEPAGMVWERGGGGFVGARWHFATWPDWGQRGWLLCLRLMRAGLWSEYRVLQKRRPAGTSCPLWCMAPALRTPLIGTPNCPYEYFSCEQDWEFGGLGVWFQGSTQWPEEEKDRETDRKLSELVNTILLLSVFSSFLIRR